MSNVTVSITGGQNFPSQQLRIIKRFADNQVQQIAEQTTLKMQMHITASIKREGSTGKLAAGIYPKKTSFGWGVGEIAYLNQFVPYWYWINYGIAQSGRSIPPSTKDFPQLRGHFEPSSAGRFVKPQPKFPIFTLKPIDPHNYIQRTVQDVNTIIRTILKQGFRI